jgi:hypothetical protein
VCSSFLLILLYHGEIDDTCCLRHDVNPIPVNIVL